MAEILWMWANTNQRRLKNDFDWVTCKRGDIVMATGDGWSWGSEELKGGFWRITRLPGLPLQRFDDWLEPVFRDGTLALKRKHYLAIDLPEAGWLREIVAVTPVSRLHADQYERFLALKRLRPVPQPELVI